MQQKSDPHIFSGMQRDLSISKHKPEALYSAKNLRFTARDGDTMLSITNEKGTTHLYQCTMLGNYLGHCVIDNYVVVFTHDSAKDRIYKLSGVSTPTLLYEGNLKFSMLHPIETLGVFENRDIQKVYWVDGINQPRCIMTGDHRNILSKDDYPNADTQFDFVATLNLNEEVTVERYEGRGMFAPGTIQYAFSYYNKYGRQSNIFYTTLLNYISYPERAGKPDERIANCFKISLTGLQTDFEYLRVYSIHRTSYNTVPEVKRVIDIELEGKTEISFIDDGQLGNSMDPTELLYIGGESILAETITQKDNTLFLGNLVLNRPAINQTYKDKICAVGKTEEQVNAILNITESLSNWSLKSFDTSNDYYKYASGLNGGLPGFKNREHYRIGVQFQHKSGKWSEPVFIGDYTLEGTNNPSIDIAQNQVTGKYEATLKEPILELNLDLTAQLENNSTYNIAAEGEYIKARPVVVFPTIEDRLVLTQGVLCPTVFSKANRKNSSPFAQSSWFFRPSIPTYEGMPTNTPGVYAPYRHLEPFSEAGRLSNGGNKSWKAIEIQGGTETLELKTEDGNTKLTVKDPPEDKQFFVDQSIVTMHSPDIEWDDNFDFLNYTDWKLRIVGASVITANCSDVDIQTATPQNLDAKGFFKQQYNTTDWYYSGALLSAGLFWEDYLVEKTFDTDLGTVYGLYGENLANAASAGLKWKYLVYPWQRSGSLNNDEIREGDSTRTAELKTKKLSNLRFSKHNKFFNYTGSDYDGTYDISQLQLFSSDQMSLIKIPLRHKVSSKELDINYYGNVDTLLSGNLSHIIISASEDAENCDDILHTAATQTIFSGGGITIAKKNSVLYSGSTPVRMKYKSSRHIVFGLTPNNDHSTNILPRVGLVPNDATGGNRGQYGKDMFWLDPNLTPGSNDRLVIIAGIFDTEDDLNNSFEQHRIHNEVVVIIKDQDNNIDPKLVKVNRVNSQTLGEYEYSITPEPAETNTIYSGQYYEDIGGVINATDLKYFKKKTTPQDVNDVEEVSSSEVQYDEEIYTIHQDVIPYSTNSDGVNYLREAYLLLAELYRDSIVDWDDADYPYFSGKTDDATKSNLWIPAGKAVKLNPDSTSVTLRFIQGDTWYTRYDCLKTYPFTQEDENQIVEIGSFLCESRINGDGRYDRNRGQVSNINMSPINFNLMNFAYNNKDNFFNYRILDKDYYTLNKFDNQITWSKEKQMAADVDLWTNVTMANTFDLDGTMGPITALRTWKDTIYCFQDNAISVISFSPRVQIPTSDGVPIEIANSYKLEGKVYISNSIGCSNKQTIVIAPSGVYFIDPNSEELYNLAGNQLTSISTAHGFSNWFKSNEFDKSFYDKNRNDLYVLVKHPSNDEPCIVYSELLGQFTSFMDYDAVEAMFNVNNDFLAFKSGIVDNQPVVNTFLLFSGLYNDFFGTYTENDGQLSYTPQYKDYSFEFISNQDSALDKIFSTVDMRVDFMSEEGVVHDDFFDKIRVTNEYQDTGEYSLSRSTGPFKADAKKKFRIWSVNVPRDKDHPLHRIRNTWAKFRFAKHNPGPVKMELHDLSVQYFI